jgi:hypothetical protein
MRVIDTSDLTEVTFATMRTMLDPLANFDWATLQDKYDARCSKAGIFQQGISAYLASFQPTPDSDRELYYALVKRFAQRTDSTPLSLGVYEGMLYWKLYSQRPAVKKHCERLRLDSILRKNTCIELARVSRSLPLMLPRNVEQIASILTGLTKGLYGMADSCALPVRTTLLHLAYPEVVPIFDVQVLKAVGVDKKDAKAASHSYEFFREYLQHAWSLADRYCSKLAMPGGETPIRAVDMALWVSRGK